MLQFSKLAKSSAFIVSVLAISLSLAYFVSAWSEPSANPPNSNVSAPLNIGSTSQTKSGSLSVTGASGVTAPVFYDTNNPAYFIDPSATVSAKLSGAIQLGSTSSVCDATSRGTIKFVTGGAGVADTLHQCIKQSDGTYNWAVATASPITADPFSFANQTGAYVSTPITSNTVTLSGGFSNLIASCGAGCTGISRNGAAFVPGPVSGFNSGDTIAIRLTSSPNLNTAVGTTVTVGTTISGVWSVTTETSYTYASTQTFTSSGTWTKPSGVTRVNIVVVGGGGGGGAGDYYYAGGGGAGGTCNVTTFIDVTGVSSVPVTVGGAGGGGCCSWPQAGAGGGTSSFGAYCTATGGGGGGPGNPPAQGASGGGAGGVNSGPGWGSSGEDGHPGTGASGTQGDSAGGASSVGPGGAGRVGGFATNAGAGGGGGDHYAGGGSGAAGRIIISEYK